MQGFANNPRRFVATLAVAAACALGVANTLAADVAVTPATGSGFVVKNAGGTERLRVDENGAVTIPAAATGAAQNALVCADAGGLVGPCAPGVGGGVGPQGPKGDPGPAGPPGPAGSGSMPAGTVNQTLRYDNTNALVANDGLQAFADGGLLANYSGTSAGIPATGTGTRMMWYPAKAAFRAGTVNGSQWDDANIGSNSVAMGLFTIASGGVSTAMGDSTMASGGVSTTMGYLTTASGDYSTAMGQQTIASEAASTAMGSSTMASGGVSTAMGYLTTANGYVSTAMGHRTAASGDYSMAMGDSTIANGNYSTAMGSHVSTKGHAGSFFYGDVAHTGTPGNSADNQFAVIASGGSIFLSDTGASAGVELKPGAGSWTTLSDRNAKTAVRPVDARAVLEKVAAMPMNTWQYKTQEARYRHMGPMAQDFYAAFALGESDTGIDEIDGQGVALAAIQGLNEKLRERDAEIAALRSELTAQKAFVVALAGDMAAIKVQLTGLHQAVPSATTVALRNP